jgi:hypothetical protein
LNVPESGSRWADFNFIVNRIPGSMESSNSPDGVAWFWKAPEKIAEKVVGNEMMLSVPRSSLGIGSSGARLRFKWADNVFHSGDILEAYQNGDVAPNGRMEYVFQVH